MMMVVFDLARVFFLPELPPQDLVRVRVFSQSGPDPGARAMIFFLTSFSHGVHSPLRYRQTPVRKKKLTHY